MFIFGIALLPGNIPIAPELGTAHIHSNQHFSKVEGDLIVLDVKALPALIYFLNIEELSNGFINNCAIYFFYWKSSGIKTIFTTLY